MTAVSENALSEQPELGDPRLARLIVRLAGPAILGISAHSLQMAVNALFVASLGSAAVAAVALAQSMTLAIAALGYGVGVGAASIVARSLGRGDNEGAGAAAATALAMIIPASAVSVAAMLTNVDWVLAQFGASPVVIETARAYAALSVIGTVVMLVHVVGGFIARAEASARFSMAVMVGSFGLNILLDALFIPILGWGIEGAGWATLIGQLAAAASYYWYFANGVSQLRLKFCWRRAVPTASEIVAIGMPATVTALLSAFSLVALLKSAAASGEAAVAAIGVSLRVLSFGMLPVLGLCSGAEAVFGFAHGAGDFRRLGQALRIVLAIASAYAFAWSGGAILFAPQLLAPFAPDSAALELAIRASNAFEAVFVLSAIAFAVLTMFQAIGAPRMATILSLASQGYVLLPLLAILPPLWGFDGVIAARTLAEAITCAIALTLLSVRHRAR
jgi:putative MATE family efflux protein